MLPSNLPSDIICNILGYADEFRCMKIKMDNKNMEYIFENDKNIGKYLYSKISSFNTDIYEDIHLQIIDYLINKKIPMESTFEKVEKHYKSCHNFNVTYELFCNIIKMIIDDYNDYYLNDEYYYGGYWYDDEWYKSSII
jgi:hypothetical protein